ncbi:phospholipase c/d [Lucifera butyrica]|uniref:Phospholipase C n=1 Tax=Lucifera butyrica TaxID=1351585 RepID=A0A498R692_9FIRM|nr:zinc dependent phospholipase C family protein [Lucifera butyrica]VBB06390.1 phospholipase c/d [Lucifera butyrica]
MIKMPSFTTLSLARSLQLLLATTSPLQCLLDRPGIAHEFCNRQAITILRQDGFEKDAALLEQFLPELNNGVYWADTGWKNVNHYFEPGAGKGLWKFANAAEDFRFYYFLALKNARRGLPHKAAFFLGAAAHLVQDLCVPHHASGQLFQGHQEYEAWAGKHFPDYAVKSQGIYLMRQPENFLINNAVIAHDFISWVNQGSSSYHAATLLLLPRAQRSTAGLFRHFLAAVAGCFLSRKAVA